MFMPIHVAPAAPNQAKLRSPVPIRLGGVCDMYDQCRSCDRLIPSQNEREAELELHSSDLEAGRVVPSFTLQHKDDVRNSCHQCAVFADPYITPAFDRFANASNPPCKISVLLKAVRGLIVVKETHWARVTPDVATATMMAIYVADKLKANVLICIGKALGHAADPTSKPDRSSRARNTASPSATVHCTPASCTIE